MEARLTTAALLVAAFASLASGQSPNASVRSEHFIVSAPTRELATEICQAAERYRKDLAIEWLGEELPPWRGVCPITAKVHPQLGAGGATSFMFDSGVPFGWTMTIQGSRERILDSVLPHEITHTIFATHFGRPLPRWADEGACTTVEHVAEKAKQDKFLIEFLHTNRGIPFNKMFAMKEYPQDILPLYSQGYSLTRFLIQQGGKRKFVDYVGEGMRTNNWPAVTRKFYNFDNLSDLQVTWVSWVGSGSQEIAPRSIEGLASAEIPAAIPDADNERPTAAESIAMARQASAYGWQAPPAQNARAFAQMDNAALPPAPSNFPAESAVEPKRVDASNVSRPVSGGWYARKRDQARGAMPSREESSSRQFPVQAERNPRDERLSPAGFEQPVGAPIRSAVAPVGSPNKDRVLMEWRRNPAPVSAQADVRGLAVQDPLSLR
jgi:hypothetical protein